MISGCPYLLFYDDFNVCRAFCKFQPDSTLNKFSVLSVVRELDLSKVAMKTLNPRFYDDFDVFSLVSQFQPGTMQNKAYYESRDKSIF